MPNILPILQELATVLATYGPAALAAEQAFVKGGFPALLAYLDTLVNPTPAPAPDPLQAVIAKLRAATGVK